MKFFVEINPRSIKIEDPRRAAAFAAGAIVLHPVTKIYPHAITILAEPQAEIDVGLALPIPGVEAADRAERFHIHERATRVRGFHFNDPMLRPRLGRAALEFLPESEGLVSGGEEQRRHHPQI